MKLFSDDYIARLNAQHSGGVFVKAAVLTVAPGDLRYYADTQHTIVFDGQTYQPLAMAWGNMGQSGQMALPNVQVTVPNVTGIVGAFLETTSLLGNDVILHLLHLDLLGIVTDADNTRLQIMMVEWDRERAIFTLGLNVALTDNLPRAVITRAEFPGVPDAMRRASIL